MQSPWARESSIVGRIQNALRVQQARLCVIYCQELEEAFGADARPATKDALEVEGAYIQPRRQLVKAWLFLKILA
jgi:hypothetical protein